MKKDDKGFRFDLRFPDAREYNELFDGEIHSIEIEEMREIGTLAGTPLFVATYFDQSFGAECEGLFRIGHNGRLIKIPLDSYENFEDLLEQTNYCAKPMKQTQMRSILANGIGVASIASADRVMQQVQLQQQAVMRMRDEWSSKSKFIGNKLYVLYNDEKGIISDKDIAAPIDDKIVIFYGWRDIDGASSTFTKIDTENLDSWLQHAVNQGYRKFLGELKEKKEIGMEEHVRLTDPYQNELLSSWIQVGPYTMNGKNRYVELNFSPCPFETRELFKESKNLVSGDEVNIFNVNSRKVGLEESDLFARGVAGAEPVDVGERRFGVIKKEERAANPTKGNRRR